ncbi:hypothetical protein J4442_04420 [Candidatus Woesearchaeota archaeon]|nr:hypothetical protein [Candidatus Woesearchaeota archaeon]
MQAYKVYWERLQTGYEGDNYYGEVLLALPEVRIKIPFSKWHLLHPNRDSVSFVKNIRNFGDGNEGFGEGDTGLEILATLNLEKWERHMKQEGSRDTNYGYIPVEVSDDLVGLLRKKIDGKTSFDEEIEINRQLKGVILN